ncbi:hypothetical protein M514_11358 [Trichuris suis]|uniref:Uncharacterized protein n=1 Tax=Trichuris suis TaxID=68888 RepID=A0A085NDG0_9BILA|nr:hypothetical protein M513_11358 [Trichuris suis]KFD67506.1 hypothetical protein M514_11358 [Trichuris suis]
MSSRSSGLRGRRRKVQDNVEKDLGATSQAFFITDDSLKEENAPSSIQTKDETEGSGNKADESTKEQDANHNTSSESEGKRRQIITFDEGSSSTVMSADTSATSNKFLERAKRFRTDQKPVCVQRKVVFDPSTLGDMEERKRKRLIRFT